MQKKLFILCALVILIIAPISARATKGDNPFGKVWGAIEDLYAKFDDFVNKEDYQFDMLEVHTRIMETAQIFNQKDADQDIIINGLQDQINALEVKISLLESDNGVEKICTPDSTTYQFSKTVGVGECANTCYYCSDDECSLFSDNCNYSVVFQECEPLQASEEILDNKDNDCDGLIDEGLINETPSEEEVFQCDENGVCMVFEEVNLGDTE